MCTGLRYLVMLLAVFYLWQERTTPGRIAVLMIVAALFLFSPRKTLVISLMFALTYPARIDSKTLVRKIGYALMAFFGTVIYYFTDTRIGLAIVLLDAMICCWCIMVRKRNWLLLRVFE